MFKLVNNAEIKGSFVERLMQLVFTTDFHQELGCPFCYSIQVDVMVDCEYNLANERI